MSEDLPARLREKAELLEGSAMRGPKATAALLREAAERIERLEGPRVKCSRCERSVLTAGCPDVLCPLTDGP